MALSFTKRIEIVELKPNDGPIPSGPEAHGDQEVLFSKAWADIKTMKGSEVQTLGLAAHEVTSRFIIRYKEGIKPYMKIKYKGKTYNIESLTNDDEQNRTITMIASSKE